MNKLISILSLTVLLTTSCAQKKDHVVTIQTSFGDMVAILYDETPKHKANFIKLAQEKFYDSLIFHRVMTNFMIQGGDPNSKNAEAGARLGNGGPGYTIDAEFNNKFFHEKGALSAARLGDDQNPTKASSGSQFYIVHGRVIPVENKDEIGIDGEKLNDAMKEFIANPENKSITDKLNEIYSSGDMKAYQSALLEAIPAIETSTGIKITKEVTPEQIESYTTIGGAPHLDGGFTVFGKVISGLDVIDKIAEVDRDRADRPTEDVIMMVTVKEMKRKKITKLYGYQYPPSK